MIKRQLTSSENVIASINENTNFATLNLEQRLESHLKLWNEFENILSQLDEHLTEKDLIANIDSET